MNVNDLVKTKSSIVKKEIFQRKPLQKEGLILEVHHVIKRNNKEKKIRFIHICFDCNGNILAANDQAANVFLIDFVISKFWVLPITIYCTILKFSTHINNELLCGICNGKIYILNIDTGDIKGVLNGHTEPVKAISFSNKTICVTSSKREAILWDLKTNNKIQVLNIASDAELKLVLLAPKTNNILTCFKDDTILIWKYETLDVLKQILPATWNKHVLKSIAFTKNGRGMVFSGYSSQLTVFMLDTWTITNVITLPQYIQAIKEIAFIPQVFDGGSNKILAILSSNGIMYFYDMEDITIINQINFDEEIIKFDCSGDGKYITCLSKSGNVNIYNLGYYIALHTKTLQRSTLKLESTPSRIKRTTSMLTHVQKEIKNVLEIDKLKAILMEFGQYPESYRLKIWSQLLKLPNNSHRYNTMINNLPQDKLLDIDKKFILENKTLFKNLKRLLSNLISWSPFFAHVTYLPVFVFPFVNIFQNEPVLNFEAVCTIIGNYCQYWFEYFPLPPINILAMIENLLLEHDSVLLGHFITRKITSKLYAWPLLEAAFSEVLIRADWSRLWDHILSNEPAFLIMCVVAYNILQRRVLFTMHSKADFALFYHNHNIIDINCLISKTYMLLHNTNESNHPRRYLMPFQKLPLEYPRFLSFPKILLDIEFDEIDKLKKELTKNEERVILKEKENEENRIQKSLIQDEESYRLQELEKIFREQIQEECEQVKYQRQKLVDLRKNSYDEEIKMLNKSRERMIENNSKERQGVLEKLLSEVESNNVNQEFEVVKAESELMKRYSELLHHKIYIEEALYKYDPQISTLNMEHRILQKQQKQLAKELEKIKDDSKSTVHLKYLNIATGIAAMDDLIAKIEIELAQHIAEQNKNMSTDHSKLKVLKLEAETKELELEVSRLLRLLSDLKDKEAKENENKLHSISHKTTPFIQNEDQFTRQQKLNEFTD